jgi:hypothetical protein
MGKGDTDAITLSDENNVRHIIEQLDISSLFTDT